MYIFNKRKDKLEKKAYHEHMKIQEIEYELPESIIYEWKMVLNKNSTTDI